MTARKNRQEPKKGDLVRVTWPRNCPSRIGIVLSTKTWIWPSPRSGGDPYVRGLQVTVMLGSGEMLVLTPRQLEVVPFNEDQEDD